MGLFSALIGTSNDDSNSKRNAGDKSIFGHYTSAEDHTEDHDVWYDAIDAWYMNKKKKK